MQADAVDRIETNVRVLVVDDDPSVATLTGEYFDRETDVHEVLVETDPRVALETVESTPRFDVVVSDFEMPRMNGLELCQRLKRQRPALPFVLFTGSAKYRLEDRPGVEDVDALVIKDGDRGRYRHLVEEVFAVLRGE
mgnify:CR=1 FL=1